MTFREGNIIYANSFYRHGTYYATPEGVVRAACWNPKSRIIVPEKVTYQGKTYTVVELGEITECISAGWFEKTSDKRYKSGYRTGEYHGGDYMRHSWKGVKEIIIPSTIRTISFLGDSVESLVPVSEAKPFIFRLFSREKSHTMQIPNGIVKIGESCFRNNTKIQSIVIPNSVKSIDNDAFAGCSNLTSVTIPSSVTSIGDSAFSGCRGLTSIEIPDSVTSIGNSAFADCSGLTSIDTSTNNPNYCSIDGVLFNKDKTTIVRYPIRKVDKTYSIPNSVTSIRKSAFSDCSDLTCIIIPNSVISIEPFAFFC